MLFSQDLKESLFHKPLLGCWLQTHKHNGLKVFLNLFQLNSSTKPSRLWPIFTYFNTKRMPLPGNLSSLDTLCLWRGFSLKFDSFVIGQEFYEIRKGIWEINMWQWQKRVNANWTTTRMSRSVFCFRIFILKMNTFVSVFLC